MVRTHTAGGNIERGHAAQRHAARRIGNELDGATLVMSYSRGTIAVAVEDGHVGDVLDVATEFGAEPAFGISNNGYHYPTGEVALELSWA